MNLDEATETEIKEKRKTNKTRNNPSVSKRLLISISANLIKQKQKPKYQKN